MSNSKLFLIGLCLIFSALMIYGTALIVNFFTGTFLFSSGIVGLNHLAITGIMAVPSIIYTLIVTGRNKMKSIEVISYASFFTLIIIVPVYLTFVLSDSLMSLEEMMKFSIVFAIILVILLGTIHFEMYQSKWRIKVAFICTSIVVVAVLLDPPSFKLETLTDEDTVAQIDTVIPPENSLLLEWTSNTMDRGNHDYISSSHNDLVIDLNYTSMRRGDVIYFKTPEYISEIPGVDLPEYLIARIVGLSGETVKIKDGQVFIDNKKLNTFYSQALRNGMDEDMYFKGLSTSNRTKKKAWRKYYSTSMKPMKVEEKTVFVLIDNWWRGHDSKNFGLLQIERIEGQVIGYEK